MTSENDLQSKLLSLELSDIVGLEQILNLLGIDANRTNKTKLAIALKGIGYTRIYASKKGYMYKRETIKRDAIQEVSEEEIIEDGESVWKTLKSFLKGIKSR